MARRERSESELRRALQRAGHAAAEIEQALERLRAARYLDDAALSERFARSRLEHHGLGSRRVRQALRRRGVAAEPAEAGLEAALTQVDEAQSLEAVARRQWARGRDTDPLRRLQKLWLFLLRRGFPPALVRARLRELFPRPWERLVEAQAFDPEIGENSED